MSQCWVLYKLGGEGVGGSKSKGTYKGYQDNIRLGSRTRDHTEGSYKGFRYGSRVILVEGDH